MLNRTLLRQETARIVNEYRIKLGKQGKPLSYAQFAWQLRTCVRKNGLSVSYQTIKNWADGIHCPEYFFITALAHSASEGSWQKMLALEILESYKRHM